jgi:hypothetical protein
MVLYYTEACIRFFENTGGETLMRKEKKKFGFVAAILILSMQCTAQQARVVASEFPQPVMALRDTNWRGQSQIAEIQQLGLDTLNRVNFWRRVMRLSPDSALLSLASDRRVFCVYSVNAWKKLGTEAQNFFRDSIRQAHQLAETEQILFTIGKNDFYDALGVIPQIDRAIPIFMDQQVDPFYAKAILLIESPGKMKKSTVGAFGAFQLMKGVAINMGLKVNKKVDERKDFAKSAWAAAKLIRTICIPYTNAMLAKRGIAIEQDELWYKLLVLHVYHAGAGNVDKALTVIAPCEGDIALIKQIWQTKAGSFGNSSQNYSQLALAAMLELDAALRED